MLISSEKERFICFIYSLWESSQKGKPMSDLTEIPHHRRVQTSLVWADFDILCHRLCFKAYTASTQWCRWRNRKVIMAMTFYRLPWLLVLLRCVTFSDAARKYLFFWHWSMPVIFYCTWAYTCCVVQKTPEKRSIYKLIGRCGPPILSDVSCISHVYFNYEIFIMKTGTITIGPEYQNERLSVSSCVNSDSWM